MITMELIMTDDEKQVLRNLAIIFGVKFVSLIILRKIAKSLASETYNDFDSWGPVRTFLVNRDGNLMRHSVITFEK